MMDGGCRIMLNDYFATLPDEVVLRIFDLLSTRDLCVVREVCRRFRDLSLDGTLWRHLDFLKKIVDENVLVLDLLSTTTSLFLERSITRNQPFSTPMLSEPLQLLHLNLSHARISSELMATLISKCSLLKELSAPLRTITDEICFYIAQNSGLVRLNLAGVTGLTDSGLLNIIENCENLKFLNISYARGTISWDDLADCLPRGIKVLELAVVEGLSEIGVEGICEACPNLVHLDISQTDGITSLSLECIGTHLKDLEVLKITQVDHPDYEFPFFLAIDLSPLAQLSKLRSLRMNTFLYGAAELSTFLPGKIIKHGRLKTNYYFHMPRKCHGGGRGRPGGLRFRWLHGDVKYPNCYFYE